MPVTAVRVPLGSRLPWFNVTSLDGSKVTTANLGQGRPVAIAFLCRHSPYVRLIEASMAPMLNEFSDRVSVVAIAPNDVRAYPDDAPEHLEQQAEECGFRFPYCIDPEQRAARAFRASCTPEFFVYDAKWRLSYHGGFDDSRPGNHVAVTGDDLRRALEAVVRGERLINHQPVAFGCSIKWSAGHEPAYSYICGTSDLMRYANV